ncbi:exodeoxyribonuclease VII large subunit [Wenzhouxiangella sp. XN79A]|uniref:exodeoxyribonuclease VII large subunit n=1 Tax=Wenzhouxiangella sp. XN79A TaxID=2724193 RepID=UPI00144A5E42|nr:exodeoxyribonuclease VII large subunit [Wenzhouxiangella sp. XN79A]NKI35981.1 exodeoxyribonuclease VII large subunit [Wenzhouxiangella sp. XN79A]
MAIAPPGPDTPVYSPIELAREVRTHLEAGFPRVWLSGEISNLSQPASGHLYFTLKDARAQVRCALFRGSRGNVATRPANGDQVLVRGRISLYEARGDCQLIADAMLPAGAGELQQAFEALKKKLEAQGLFDPARKRPLPEYPDRIAVVTSPTGAALRDILTTLQRRWPAAAVRVHASPVQGEAAPARLIRALQAADRGGHDVILLARGGGSLEDLWAFNDEGLARAIAGASTPIVSGVGHETDFTIADFVADQRAATPTAAAEAVTPDGPALVRRIAGLSERLRRAAQRCLQQDWQRLDALDRRLGRRHPRRALEGHGEQLAALQRRLRRAAARGPERAQRRLEGLELRLQARHPAPRLREQQRRVAELRRRLVEAVGRRLERAEARLGADARALNAVSPLAVLDRGYAVLLDEHDHVLSQRDDFAPGTRFRARIRDFAVDAEVREVSDAE